MHSLTRLLGRLVRAAVVLALGYYALCVLGLVYLRFFPPLTTAVQIERRVESWFEPGPYHKRMHWQPLADLPPHVPHAVVAAEDSRFFVHHGFDWEEFERAGEQAQRRGGERRGASTITQQLVKNLFLTTSRSVLRKAAEYSLTPVAELILPKRRILELYLNVIEWGRGVYGIEAASRYYYAIPATELTRDQAARLAAIIPAPTHRRPERMGDYAQIILDRMATLGW